MKAKAGVFVLAAIVLLSLTSVQAGPQAHDATRQGPAAFLSRRIQRFSIKELIKRDHRFRRSFGLRSDRAFIASLYRHPGRADLGTYKEFFALLTAEESKNLEDSDNLSEAVEPIQRYIRNHELADVFAGVYIDHQAESGLAHVGFTNDVSEHVAALRNVFAYPERLRGFQATHTERELSNLVERIGADMPELKETYSIDVHTVATSVKDNLVEVTVDSATPEAVQTLESRYGPDIISVLEGGPYSFTHEESGPFSVDFPAVILVLAVLVILLSLILTIRKRRVLLKR